MIPPEMIIFTASSTEILRRITSFSGTRRKNPEVGFGDVGRKTVIAGSDRPGISHR
jgi:hypothetical protein